jgi:hypothetical protein
MYDLRDGVAALKEPAIKRRLSELSKAQVQEVGMRVQNFKPHIAPVWLPNEVAALIAIWNRIHA